MGLSNLGIILITTLAIILSYKRHHKVFCNESTSESDAPLFDVTSYYNFSSPNEMNKYGIFTTKIVHIEFKAFEKMHLWRTNPAFMTKAIRDSFQDNCARHRTTNYENGYYLNWANCTYNDNQMTQFIEVPIPEFFDKNVTYIEIKIKAFSAKRNDLPVKCILNEFPHRKAYIVLKNEVRIEEDGTEIRVINKSQLDTFPHALSVLEDLIEVDKILQFYPEDYDTFSKHYKCILAIATGNRIDIIKSNCKFKCGEKNAKETKKIFTERERFEL